MTLLLRGVATHSVMAGLVPAIHVLSSAVKDVDARHKAGHDAREEMHRPTQWQSGDGFESTKE
jgi:hypothetical protein